MTTPLIGPDGRRYEMADTSPEALVAMQAHGYRLETPEAPRTTGEALSGAATEVGGALEAGTEGVLQGVTAGGYGILKGASLNAPQKQGESEELYRLRKFRASETVRAKEEHPLASGVGEFAGMLLSPLGEIGAGAKASTALGRVGLGVGKGMVQGGLYGAGNTVSDAMLGDHELTGESLLAGAGMGALLGGAGGGVGEGIVEGAKAVVPKLAKSLGGASGKLDDFATGRWLKASGGIKADIDKVPLDLHEAVADVLRTHLDKSGSLADAATAIGAEREVLTKQVLGGLGVSDAGGLTSAMNRDAAKDAMATAFEKEGTTIGDVVRKADAMGATPTFSQFGKRVGDFMDGLNPAERDIIKADAEKVTGYLQEMASKPIGAANGFEALNSIKSTLQKNINWRGEASAKTGLQQQLIGILRNEIDTQLAPQIGSDLTKEFLDAKSAFGALKRGEEALRKKTATGADAIKAMVADAELATPETARLTALDHADNLVKAGMARRLGNRAISPTDYLAGLGGAALHGSAPGVGSLMSLGSAVAHKFMREEGSRLVAKLADKLADSPAMSALAASFSQKLTQVGPALGDFGAKLGAAAAISPAHALATHMVLAREDPHYAQLAQRAGFSPEDPAQHDASLVKARGLAQIAGAATAHEDELDSHVSAVLRGDKSPPSPSAGGRDFGSGRRRANDTDGHQAHLDEVRELAASPDALLERVSKNMGNMANVAPGVAAAMTGTADKAVKYLAAAGAQPPKAGPLAPDWHHTEAERHAFAQKREVVLDPMAVMRHAAAGTLTSQQMDALRTVYPSLARKISDKVLMAAMNRKAPMTPRSRFMSSLLTGADIDGSLGVSIARNQAAIHASSAKPSNAGTPAGPGAGARAEKVHVASRFATPSQRREMKED